MPSPSPSPDAPHLVSKDRPFSAGCVFWFAIVGFGLTCAVVFSSQTVRSFLPKLVDLLSSNPLASTTTPQQEVTVKKFQTVTLGEKQYRLEVVDTEATRQRGLSERESLAPGTGMVFRFDASDRYTFWMEKMRFSIDMLFLQNGTIVNIAHNVPFPKTPTESPAMIRPLQVFNEVIELPAGEADALGLKVGQRVEDLGY